MKKQSRNDEWLSRRRQAQDAFTRAAAMLTDPVADQGEILFWVALGSLRLSQSFHDERVFERAAQIIEQVKAAPERGAGS